jgi:hypothetical protein
MQWSIAWRGDRMETGIVVVSEKNVVQGGRGGGHRIVRGRNRAKVSEVGIMAFLLTGCGGLTTGNESYRCDA